MFIRGLKYFVFDKEVQGAANLRGYQHQQLYLMERYKLIIDQPSKSRNFEFLSISSCKKARHRCKLMANLAIFFFIASG